MLAVRDNEDAAAAVGVDAFRVKLQAIALSGLFMGLAGVFYAQRFLYLDPDIAFGPNQSVEALLGGDRRRDRHAVRPAGRRGGAAHPGRAGAATRWAMCRGPTW